MSGKATSSTRLLAVVLFLAAPIAIAGTAAVYGLAWQETETLIARQEALLRQMELRLARAETNGRAPIDTGAIYLPATTRPLAGAALQTRLTSALAEAGGKLVEVQALDEDPEAPADAVSLKLTFDVTNGGFLAFLHGIETGLPLMTIDSAAVRQLPTQEAETDDPVLRIDLTVRAFFKADA